MAKRETPPDIHTVGVRLNPFELRILDLLCERLGATRSGTLRILLARASLDFIPSRASENDH